MSFVNASIQILTAIVYLPLAVFIVYPLILLIGIGYGILNILMALAGVNPDRFGFMRSLLSWFRRLWRWNQTNIVSLTKVGGGSFSWLPTSDQSHARLRGGSP